MGGASESLPMAECVHTLGGTMTIAARFRIVCSLALVAAGLAVGLTVAPSGAAAAAGLACRAAQEPSSGGTAVTWSGEVPGAWRYVVERNISDGWSWRGRTQAPGASFRDAAAPPGSIQLEYRVKVLAADRAVLTTVDCTVVFAQPFSCSMRAFELGETQVRWDPALGTAIDYVVLAQPFDGNQLYWQNRTEATSYRLARPTDMRPPSRVRVTARDGKRIVGSAICSQWNTVTESQIYCTAVYDTFFKTFVGIHSSISFNGEPRERVVDWYRQLAPGQPWELRFFAREIVVGSFAAGEPPPPGTDAALILYRLELWNADHTELLETQICDGRRNSTRSRRF